MRHLASLAALTLLAPGLLAAHGGGLDSRGCHTNRKTGDYHCHRSSPSSPPPPRHAPAPAPPPAAAPLGVVSRPSPSVERFASAIDRVTDAEAIMICLLLLKRLGYDTGPVGPSLSDRSRAAIASFQEEHDLDESNVNGRLLLALAQEVAAGP